MNEYMVPMSKRMKNCVRETEKGDKNDVNLPPKSHFFTAINREE
jgi:hypothetical protein